MALVSSTIPNLINGVSQQPAEIRLPSQATKQENGLSSVVSGLEKRPGTEHIKKLDVSSISGAFIHTIQRDEDESYTLIVGGEDIAKTISSIAYTSATTTTATITGHTFLKGETVVISSTTNFDGTVTISSVTDANTVVFTQAVDGATATETSGTATGKGTSEFMKIYDRQGNSMPIKTSAYGTVGTSNLGYFDGLTSHAENIVATTVADNTFIINKQKTIAEATTSAATSGEGDDDGETVPSTLHTSVSGSDGLDTGYSYESLIYVKQGDYSSKYVVSIKNTEANSTYAINTEYKVAYQTPSNTPAQNQEYIGTNKIAQILDEGQTEAGSGEAWGDFAYDTTNNNNTIVGFGGRLPLINVDENGSADAIYEASLQDIEDMTDSPFKFTRTGSVIHVQSKVEFELTVEDSHGNRDIFAFTPDFQTDGVPEATKFTDLPASNAPDNFIMRVIGDNTRQQDDYYVKFTGSNWKEHVAPGLKLHFDMTTMPHRLVRIFDDANINVSTNPLGVTFIYEPIQEATITKTVGGTSTPFVRQGWRSRKVGDDTTNPFPTFLDNTINDIFFHRNRLGFLSDENVIFSEAGNYFNFFATTALTSVDSNPIDVAVSNNQVSILRHAVPFNEALLLFSELQQFKVTAGDALTPTSVSIDVSTQFPSSSRAKPTPAGKYVFFPFKRGEFSGIREYFIDFTSEVNDATEVTAHIPQYIPGEVTKLSSSSNEDILVCLSSTESKNMYVYRYYWQGNEKLMSSWSVWKFDADIIDCEFLGSKLHVLFERTSDGVYLETINLSTDTSEAVMDDTTPVLLDRRVKLSQSTSTLDTVAEIPYYSDMPSDIVYVTQNARKIAQADVDTFIAADSDNAVYAGIPYTFTYEFSKFTYRQNDVPIQTAKLQLRNLNLLYSDSGYFTFKVELAPYTQTINDGSGGTESITPRSIYNKIFNGFITNTSSIDKYTLLSGTFKGSIFSNASNCKVSLTNDEYLPCSFQSAEWEGYLHLRSQRV